ncbi:MAG: hypothetical protein ACFFD4_17780 [Candidatus Odinarchaeota archaeon]
MKINPSNSDFRKIFYEFRRGVFYEDLYEKYGITESNLISILRRNIKGNYDFKRILSGGLKAQKQFIRHLKNRWNPLEPDAPWENISPYLPLKKEKVNDED